MSRSARATFVVVVAISAGCSSTRHAARPCPTGVTCSDATPYGIVFVGDADVADPAPALGDPPGITPPHATATGGTQDLLLRYQLANPDGTTTADLDLPFAAAFDGDDAGAAITVDHITGSTVTLRGGAIAGARTLRITDPSNGEQYDEISIASLAPATALVETPAYDVSDPSMVAVFAGSAAFTIGVRAPGTTGQPIPIIDTSMTITVTDPDATGIASPAWNQVTIASAPAGMLDLALQIGGGMLSVDFPDSPVVSAIDTVTQLVSSGNEVACFGGYAQGKEIRGLTWMFSADGGNAVPTAVANCFALAITEGPIVLHATAAGVTANVPIMTQD